MAIDTAGDVLGGLECPAPGERAEPPKELFFAVVEEVVAPVDGGAQTLVSFGPACAAPGKDLSEPVSELGGCECGDAGGGQFDGEGEATNPATDVDDGRGILTGEAKGLPGGAGTLDEEGGGGDGREVFGGWLAGGRGEFQWLDQEDNFIAELERGPARGEDVRFGAAGEYLVNKRGDAGGDVFAIIENHEDGGGIDERLEAGGGGGCRFFNQSEGRRAESGQVRRWRGRVERDIPGAAGKGIADCVGGFECQAGFAGSACASEGEEPC